MTMSTTYMSTPKIYTPSSPTPSVTSISSAASSVWSEAPSVASSTATSVASSVFDGYSAPPTAVVPPLAHPTACSLLRRQLPSRPVQDISRSICPGLTTPVPLEQRQHHRRTNRLMECVPQIQQSASIGESLPPVPTLQRQADRKVNFVENLVDSAAQIVETIWEVPKHLQCAAAPKEDVLPLRTFIQETLRRSRTSYSTLQVALYYLIVIRPHLPGMGFDVTDMDPEEVQLVHAKQCGRRMFLAALILASKYLQDRNYSARAWSKISGLNTQEININEKAFLKAVDWKLHISEVVFQKWTDLVLKYTSAPSASPVSPTRSSPWNDEEARRQEWCDLIAKLSPDLREVELFIPQPARVDTDNTSPAHIDLAPAMMPAPISLPSSLRKTNSMPVPLSMPLRTLEPQLQSTNAFSALHQSLTETTLPIPMPPSLRRASGSLHAPAAGIAIKSGPAMASVMACASSNTDPGETFVRPSSRNSTTAASRRSSLANCVSFERQQPHPTTCLVRPISTPKLATSTTPNASPKSTEAAWALNLLRDAPTSSPMNSPCISRKRSCPSVSTGVTPRLKGLSTGSPVGKRPRCAFEWEGRGAEVVVR